ncbi:AraC family transcriptional regulator [Niallia sp. MER 6]|uniref:AraC family transcriptional regulator n=1 Tax=Niallia sp. MER 6 TaxID=2939567 RepID=UPI00203D3C2C|nr:AraC family transcriptional regulator [Niallia sp. MER 6]MCM3033840.1 AraC family transcriptional regulator [Niallia sp. MER 6]
MNYEELNDFLYKLSDIEIELQNSTDITDETLKELILTPYSSSKLTSNEANYWFNFTDSIMNSHSHPSFSYTLADGILKLNVTEDIFVVSRHTRFAKMLNHTHDLFEMNYIYSGTFIQEVQGEKLTLSEGDILFLNKNVEHSINKVGKEDILINFLAKKDFFDNQFIYKILGDNVLGKTIASIITNTAKEKNFLLFRTADNWQIKQTIQNILCEAFSSKSTNIEIIKAYIGILFSRLLESNNYELFLKESMKDSSISILELLAYIEENFLDLTLEETAKHFKFSSAHLGRIIKRVTGKNFLAIVQELRFKHASMLLQFSNKSIDDISREIGYNNLTYFYRKFRLFYGVTPNEYRNEVTIETKNNST